LLKYRHTLDAPLRGFLLIDLPPLKWSSLKYVFQMEDNIDGKKRHTAEEIVAKLGQVDVLMAKGRQVADAVRAIGVMAE
jgi:CRISPR/Cas system CSM-associated protein Csm2 small subunit